jgi:glycosyltransferase involved in cell wall biosynthesis
MTQELVSILMPVKNEAKFIQEAIQSVLNQSHVNFELIIVNDGSTDETAVIISGISDQRVTLIDTDGVGKNNAFNLAYTKSKGSFYCCFAGDDLMPKDSIEKRLFAFQKTSSFSQVVLSKLQMFSDNKKFDGVIIPRSNEGGYSGGTMMFSEKLANKIFPLPTVLANEDMWMSLIIRFSELEIYHQPLVTLKYRIHANNSSSKTSSFKSKTESMHKRFIVYGLFLEKFRTRLNEEQKAQLAPMSAAETLRYQNDWLSLLFMSGLSFSEKARFIFHSTSFFYWLRQRLFSFFSGRS